MMAIDGKYGRVTTERGTIGDDEPVVVFRAQDKFLPYVLDAYHAQCVANASPVAHLTLIRETRARVVAWQTAQTRGGSQINKVKVPD